MASSDVSPLTISPGRPQPDRRLGVPTDKEIHAGLDKYEAYLVKCTQQPSKYSADELRAIMKSFEEVLFLHLDEEVLSLKGKNMSKYWTLDEIARLPM